MGWSKEGDWHKLNLSDSFIIYVTFQTDGSNSDEVCFVCPVLKTPVWIKLNNKINTSEETKKEALRTVFEYINKMYVTIKKHKQWLKSYL